MATGSLPDPNKPPSPASGRVATTSETGKTKKPAPDKFAPKLKNKMAPKSNNK